MKLDTKFNVALLGTVGVGLLFTGAVSYNVLERNAQQEIVERAGLMLEAALATRGYTVAEVRPLVAPHMSDVFLPQTVPAYAATRTFDRMRENRPAYHYKEATLNPTNPTDRATDWEADIVTAFRDDESRQEIIGTRNTPTGESLYIARPIKVGSPACLGCHSTAEAAPPSLVKVYGGANGFGWALNEVVGAQIVSVPMSVPVERARKTFYTFIAALVAVFVAIMVVLNVLLKRMVVKPILAISAMSDTVSRGDFSGPEFEAGGDDELSVLGASLNRMRRSLDKAMKMLQ